LQLSVGSSKTKLSKTSTFLKHHAVLGTNTHASFHVYPQCRPISFSRSDMQLLTLMKQSTHDNINPFLGMSFNEKDEMVLLWKFCSRGTIQDIIYNSEIVLDGKFHGAFVRDITSGLEYLHTSPIGYHGSLTPWACLIDRNWMIKLTDFGIASSLERWERKGLISTESLKEDDEDGKSGSLQKTIFESKKVLEGDFSTTGIRNRIFQKWLKQVQSLRQMGDIYALGMVMYEILFRGIPFPSSIDIDELIENINSGENTCRPSIQDNSNVHPNLIALLSDCWSKNPEIRPSIRRVRINTRTYLEYANNLEKLVQERTGMLEDANARADKLLSQLLPK
uniref:guanylate cyclase n=1 Tax=Angiostrongylus cantonensis TaxID=6313 RepID=A0A0K0D148_ANGCA